MVCEERHRPEELDPVLEPLQSRGHHDVLEDAALQHPHLAARVGWRSNEMLGLLKKSPFELDFLAKNK